MCFGRSPEVSFTTLYEVGLTVPWFTDCETRKKSYLNRMASACDKTDQTEHTSQAGSHHCPQQFHLEG